MMRKALLESVPERRRCSRYAVRLKDFLRMSAIEVWLKTLSDAHNEARSTTDGLDTW